MNGNEQKWTNKRVRETEKNKETEQHKVDMRKEWEENEKSIWNENGQAKCCLYVNEMCMSLMCPKNVYIFRCAVLSLCACICGMCVWLMTFAHKTETLPSDKLLPISLSMNVISFVASVCICHSFIIYTVIKMELGWHRLFLSHTLSLSSSSFSFSTSNFSSHLVCASVRAKAVRKYYFVFIIHLMVALSQLCLFVYFFLSFEHFGSLWTIHSIDCCCHRSNLSPR